MITDFGELFSYVVFNLIIPIFNKEILLFGQSIKILNLVAFVVVGEAILYLLRVVLFGVLDGVLDD